MVAELFSFKGLISFKNLGVCSCPMYCIVNEKLPKYIFNFYFDIHLRANTTNTGCCSCLVKKNTKNDI